MKHNGRDITVSVALSQHVRQMQRSLDRKLDALSRGLTSSSVHACRTQTRRLRAFLRAFRHAFDPSAMVRYEKVLRRLTHDLSSARSAHVEQQIIAQMAEDQGIRNDDGLRELRAIAAQVHARAVVDLRAMMTDEAWLRRLARMRRAASDPALIVESPLPMAAMTARILRRRRRRLRRQLRLHHKSPKQLHKIRLKIKTLRYLLERCVPDEAAVRTELKQLRLLQDRLGELHDEWILQSRLERQPRHLRASMDICSRIRGHRDELLQNIEKHENHLLRIWKELDRRRDRRTAAAA
jgi:CHAD domain-containing protein